MSSRVVRWAGGVLLAAGRLLASAPPSHAPHIAQIQITPSQVQAGQEVPVFGPRGYGRTNPVDIRWDSLDGPVLGTFQPNEELYALWGPGTIRIPEDARPGIHFLFATQTLAANETHIRGVPARGEVTVVGEGGTPVLGRDDVAPADQTIRGLVEDEPVSMGTVLLVALGTAGVGLFVAGGAAAIASRRRSAAGAPTQAAQ